ncbi:hypothetical protein C9374_008643 [Naegleria lovaniensis]|uniref:Uncharacterized protein n=1 Tax=Naegleria lovaniensis TaxID=51637 RepID=A0AA88GKB2_NAELO|nr:uncharacterized protein C9374_008643 [Naegleria lovaniensis]KAG2378021.1 hypothetical protein C9374_008643 [Naegleria lovaniensis]
MKKVILDKVRCPSPTTNCTTTLLHTSGEILPFPSSSANSIATSSSSPLACSPTSTTTDGSATSLNALMLTSLSTSGGAVALSEPANSLTASTNMLPLPIPIATSHKSSSSPTTSSTTPVLPTMNNTTTVLLMQGSSMDIMNEESSLTLDKQRKRKIYKRAHSSSVTSHPSNPTVISIHLSPTSKGIEEELPQDMSDEVDEARDASSSHDEKDADFVLDHVDETDDEEDEDEDEELELMMDEEDEEYSRPKAKKQTKKKKASTTTAHSTNKRGSSKKKSPSSPTSTCSTTTTSIDALDAHQQTQTMCCLKGCDHPISNRLRFSLRVCSEDDFKSDYVQRGFNWVCNYHYFHDLYLYKKNQKGDSNSTNRKKKASKKKSNTSSTSTANTAVVETSSNNTASMIAPTTSNNTGEVNSSALLQIVSASLQANTTIATNTHNNMELSQLLQPSLAPALTESSQDSSMTKRKRSSSNASSPSKKKKQQSVGGAVLNTSTNISLSTSAPAITVSSTILSMSPATSQKTISPTKQERKRSKSSPKKPLKIDVSANTLQVPTNNMFVQPSPVHTDDVIALINFVSHANQ